MGCSAEAFKRHRPELHLSRLKGNLNAVTFNFIDSLLFEAKKKMSWSIKNTQNLWELGRMLEFFQTMEEMIQDAGTC